MIFIVSEGLACYGYAHFNFIAGCAFLMTWFVVFASVVFALYFWAQYRSRQRELQSPTAAHRLGLRYIGEALVLEAPIQNGVGRVRLGNREWQVRGPNLPAGARVRVTGVDGTVLLVDRLAA